MFILLESIVLMWHQFLTHNEFQISVGDMQVDTNLRDPVFGVCFARDPYADLVGERLEDASSGSSSLNGEGRENWRRGDKRNGSTGKRGGGGAVARRPEIMDTIHEAPGRESGSVLDDAERHSSSGSAEDINSRGHGAVGGQTMHHGAPPPHGKEETEENLAAAAKKRKKKAIFQMYARHRTKITKHSLNKRYAAERYGKYDIMYFEKVRVHLQPVLFLFDLQLVSVMQTLFHKFQNVLANAGANPETSGGAGSGGSAARRGGRQRAGRDGDPRHEGRHGERTGSTSRGTGPPSRGTLQQYRSLTDFFGELDWNQVYEHSALYLEDRSSATRSKIFFENFLIESAKVTASFQPGAHGTRVIGIRNAFLRKILANMAGIDQCALDFERLSLTNHLCSGDGISTVLATCAGFYKNQFVGQFNRLLLSADLIGNPQNAFNYFGDGMYAFIKEPYEGFQKSALDGMSGVAKGSAAFLRNVTTGVADTGVKMLSNLNQGLSSFTMEANYYKKLSQRRQTNAMNHQTILQAAQQRLRSSVDVKSTHGLYSSKIWEGGGGLLCGSREGG